MAYSFGKVSLSKLEGVHPDLVKVMKRAIEITPVDFKITEGVRTVARQKKLVAAGASKTMKSRHIPSSNKSGLACAVDIVPYVGSTIRYDWPLYYKLAPAVKQAAKEVGVPIEWGGDWKNFKDGPHFQLPAKQYPYA